MDTIDIKAKLEEKKDHIGKVFHVKEIGLFGSFVKGVQSKKSDVDVLVEFEKGHKDFFNYMRLKYYLEEMLGREVDLIIKGAIKPRLKEKILNEVVYV
jgi:predicted nucleotidyltransferase